MNKNGLKPVGQSDPKHLQLDDSRYPLHYEPLPHTNNSKARKNRGTHRAKVEARHSREDEEDNKHPV